MDKIEGDFRIYKTGAPVFDAHFIDGSWRWTGWRHDGNLTNEEVDIFKRRSVGVSLVNESVLTNDGSWRAWGLIVRLDRIAAPAAYFPIAVLPKRKHQGRILDMGFPS